MILQALCEYYKRKANDPESGIAPEGFGYAEIPFLVRINKNGDFLNIDDTRNSNGKRLVGKKFLVKAPVSRTIGIKANLLWDKADYALGMPDGKKLADIEKKSKKDPEKYTEAYISEQREKLFREAGERFKAFKTEIKRNFPDEPSVKALLSFLEKEPFAAMKQKMGDENELLSIIEKENPNIGFWIDGDEKPICSLFNEKIKRSDIQNDQGICLVTGEKTAIERIHPMLKNVVGAQSSGAAIISFNQPSFTSYGKKQNFNAPVSKAATFAYTTALNLLLSKESQNKIRIGDMTAVFWSERKTEFETFFSSLWNCAPKDNPDADVLAVKQLYNSINTGAETPDCDTKFYILGLSPNAARLSVRLWQVGTVNDFSGKIRQHFDDLKIIISPKNDSGHCALFYLLASLVRDIKDIPPNLSGNITNSILLGTPYPAILQQLCLQRIRKDLRSTPSDSRMRAAILKACLNRKNRLKKSNEKELTMALDPTNENIGYRLGRLFATFEKLQEDAQRGINATIKERYYGAASSTPCTVYPLLFKLKNHHLAKLDNPNLKVYYEKRIGEIVSGIPAEGVPAHLNLDDQSRFAIGYYHQRQDLFTKKNEEK